jgi:tripartite-type tricarboxylate transporter receptor subunit TctC
MRKPKSFMGICVAIFMVIFIAGAIFTSQAQAQKYPDKPVTFVVTHTAGGATDLPIRVMQPFVQKHLGVPVAIDNKPGAGGNIARSYVYKHSADGYTLLMSQQPSLSTGYFVSDGDFDPLKFEPIFNIAGAEYQGIAVPYDSPIKNLKDMLEASKKRQLTICGAGIGATSFLNVVVLQQAGFNLQYVPFNSSPEAVMAVAGGSIDVGCTTYHFWLPLAQQKKLRLIAVLGDKRGVFAPDVPTAREQGIDVALDQLSGVFGPPGLAKEKVNILAAAFEKASKEEDCKKAAEKAKVNLFPMGPADFKREFMVLHKVTQAVAPALKAAAK